MLDKPAVHCANQKLICGHQLDGKKNLHTLIMRDFFKPWRRKLGVVTLGLACVFMVGWIRSIHKREYLCLKLSAIFDGGPFLTDLWGGRPFAVSDSGRIEFRFYVDPVTYPIEKDFFDGADDGLWHSLITVESFRIGSGWIRSGGHAIVIGYWLIVLPLTLLSAYLLLVKPRTAKPAQAIGRAE